MKRGMVLILTAMLIVAFSFAVAAKVMYKENTVDKNYAVGDSIRGDISLSFSKEPAFGIVSSNINTNKSLKLFDFLVNNGFEEGSDFNCSIRGCQPRYKAEEPISSMDIQIKKKSLAGLKISGTEESISSIDSASLRIRSSIGPSCAKQISVEFLGNSDLVVTNTKSTSNVCSSEKNYGCFSSGVSYSEASIRDGVLCEKVTIEPAPAYKSGTNVKRISGDAQLTMEMRSEDGEETLGECSLPTINVNGSYIERECVIPYSSNSKKSVLLCISGESEGDYKIRYETTSPRCGTANLGESFTRDFEIFVRAMEFDGVNFEINDSQFEDMFGESLSSYIYDYVSEKYEGVCDPSCVIPFAITGASQKVYLEDAKIEWTEEDGLQSEDKNIFNIVEEQPLINSGVLSLDMENANFIIDSGTNTNIFHLSIGGEKVFSKNINITASFPIELKPRNALIGIETNFNVLASSPINISRWDFGDGAPKTSGSKTMKHRFTESGEYDVEVEAVLSNGLSSKRTFKVYVGNPKESAELIIPRYESRVNNVDKQLVDYSQWISLEIRNALSWNETKEDIKSIKKEFSESVEEEDYTGVVDKLLAMDIPYSVKTRPHESMPLLESSEYLDTYLVQEISETEGEDDEVFNKIYAWEEKNYEGTISATTYSVLLESGEEAVFTYFEADVSRLNALEYDVYMFISRDSDEMKFNPTQKTESLDSGTAIKLSDENEKIEFIIPGLASIDELGIHVSPVIEYLPELGCTDEECSNGNGWVSYVIWFLASILLIMIIYVVIQEIYKKKYQKNMFAKESDFYNVLTFISNSRKLGLDDAEIRKKLLSAGWRKNQVDYAFSKADGKRSSFEIPVFRGQEQQRMKEEISRRKFIGTDTRFIKGPGHL